MAAATPPRTRCTTAIRLFRSIACWWQNVLSLDHDDLTVARHSQMQPLLHQRRKLVSTGGVPDLALQLRALSAEVRSLALELLERPRLRKTERAPPDDARRHEDETKKCERDHRPPPAPRHAAAALGRYGALRHALNLALRARGFRSASSGAAVTGLLVSSVPRGWPRHVHVGWRGGAAHAGTHATQA